MLDNSKTLVTTGWDDRSFLFASAPAKAGASLSMRRFRREPHILERVKGIEPSSSAWKAVALPLSYTRSVMAPSGWRPPIIARMYRLTGCKLAGAISLILVPHSKDMVEGVGFEPT